MRQCYCSFCQVGGAALENPPWVFKDEACFVWMIGRNADEERFRVDGPWEVDGWEPLTCERRTSRRVWSDTTVLLQCFVGRWGDTGTSYPRCSTY